MHGTCDPWLDVHNAADISCRDGDARRIGEVVSVFVQISVTGQLRREVVRGIGEAEVSTVAYGIDWHIFREDGGENGLACLVVGGDIPVERPNIFW